MITSLRVAELLDIPGLLGDLDEILTAARSAPSTVPDLLEHRSLRLLHERFPYAAPVQASAY